jgi:hypothetical protein
MSESLAQYQWPPGAKIISYCPLSTCSWQHHDGPLPEGFGATIDEVVTDVLAKHFAALEEICQAHLGTHPLLEWVQEVMRLREQAAGAVTVSRDDLVADRIREALDAPIRTGGGDRMSENETG